MINRTEFDKEIIIDNDAKKNDIFELFKNNKNNAFNKEDIKQYYLNEKKIDLSEYQLKAVLDRLEYDLFIKSKRIKCKKYFIFNQDYEKDKLERDEKEKKEKEEINEVLNKFKK